MIMLAVSPSTSNYTNSFVDFGFESFISSVPNCLSKDSDDLVSDSAFGNDDSGFFEFDSSDSEFIMETAHKIGAQLIQMCDDFDREFMACDPSTASPSSWLDRLIDWFF